jgi:hypothetical protein
MPTPAQTRKAVIDFMVPFMDTPASRQALVSGALWGQPYVANIDWTGAPTAFTSSLFDAVWRDGGAEAVHALLDEIATHTGTNNQAKVEQLKADLATMPGATSSVTPAPTQPQSGGPTFNIGGSVTGSNVNIGGVQTITNHNPARMKTCANCGAEVAVNKRQCPTCNYTLAS